MTAPASTTTATAAAARGVDEPVDAPWDEDENNEEDDDDDRDGVVFLDHCYVVCGLLEMWLLLFLSCLQQAWLWG